MTDVQLASNPLAKVAIPGIKELLMGGVGTGKTYSLITMLEAGIEVFAVFTEPGMETALSAIRERGLGSSKFHWVYLPPASPSFDSMLDSAKKINTLSQSALQKLDGMDRAQYTQFMELLKVFANFTDQNGVAYGPVDSWAPDRCLWMDSLSGINVMAMDLVVGDKPIKGPADWQMAMDRLSRLVSKLCGDVRAHVVMIAHVEPEKDDVTGRVTLMASTLGKRLAPTIPRFFSDVIYAYREGDKFLWSTMEVNVDVKARNYPMHGKLPPSFAPAIAKWKANAGVV